MKLVINEKKFYVRGKDVYLIAEAGVNHGGNLELAKND